MSNQIYVKAKEAMLNGGINWLTDTIKAALVQQSYTPNINTDNFYTTIATHVIGTPVVLSGKTNVGGVANANSVTFTAVPTPSAGPNYVVNNVKYVAIYKDTGTAGTSLLIALIDSGSGIPISSNNGDIVVNWATSPTAEIFAIS